MENGMEFFTATCLNWQNLLGTERHKQVVLESLKFLTTCKEYLQVRGRRIIDVRVTMENMISISEV